MQIYLVHWIFSSILFAAFYIYEWENSSKYKNSSNCTLFFKYSRLFSRFKELFWIIPRFFFFFIFSTQKFLLNNNPLTSDAYGLCKIWWKIRCHILLINYIIKYIVKTLIWVIYIWLRIIIWTCLFHSVGHFRSLRAAVRIHPMDTDLEYYWSGLQLPCSWNKIQLQPFKKYIGCQYINRITNWQKRKLNTIINIFQHSIQHFH